MAKEAAVRRADAGPARIQVANCELLYGSRSAERAHSECGLKYYEDRSDV
jgi:hypothetical protein